MQEEFNLYNQTVQDQCQSMVVDQVDIDERIDITQIQLQNTTPLQSPDLLKYYYMTQLLLARNNSNGDSSGRFEDWMFKELVSNESDTTKVGLLPQENEVI